MRKRHPTLGPMLSSVPAANSLVSRAHLDPRTTPKTLFKSLMIHPSSSINKETCASSAP